MTENASYYIFTQCPDGAFEAFPVHGWYNFTPVAKHRTLTAEEAEEEWGRLAEQQAGLGECLLCFKSHFLLCPGGTRW